MLDKIVSILTGKSGTSAVSAETNGRRISIATCVLLLEMAKADGDFGLAEKIKIRAILKKNAGLSEPEIDEIISAAENEEEKSVDLWAYTNLINMHFTDAHKIQLVEMIWELAFADGSLDDYEDYLMHKFANLLEIKHQDLIAAKLRAMESVGRGGNRRVKGS